VSVALVIQHAKRNFIVMPAFLNDQLNVIQNKTTHQQSQIDAILKYHVRAEVHVVDACRVLLQEIMQ
jgi:predicted nucleic acid-binding protein